MSNVSIYYCCRYSRSVHWNGKLKVYYKTRGSVAANKFGCKATLNFYLLSCTDTPLLRRSKTYYADGVYQPSGNGRPNPLDISKAVHQGDPGLPSYYGRTAMLVYFGEYVCSIGEAPITHMTHVRNKNSNTQGRSPYVEKRFSIL